MTFSSPSPRRAPAVRALAATLALAIATGPVAAQQPAAAVRLPALGESASADLSVSAEKRLGDQILREVAWEILPDLAEKQRN